MRTTLSTGPFRFVAQLMQLAIVGAIILTPLSCGQSQSTSENPYASVKEELVSALRRQAASHNDDSFVYVFGTAESQLVQFAKSSPGQIVIDIPTANMSEDELSRARDFFLNLPKSTHSDVSQYANLSAGDPQAAAELALQAFRDIYLIDDDESLSVDEN